MRDWAKTLRRGSKSIIEEMGLKTAAFEVTAYLAGDTADIQAAALKAAFLAEGPGLLVLPTMAATMAHVEDFRRLFAKDQLGYIAMGFRAIPMSNTAGSLPTPGDVLSAVAANLASAAVDFSRIFR